MADSDVSSANATTVTIQEKKVVFEEENVSYVGHINLLACSQTPDRWVGNLYQWVGT